MGFRGKLFLRYPPLLGLPLDRDRPFQNKQRSGGVAAIVCDTTGNTVRQGYCYTCLAIGGYFGQVTKMSCSLSLSLVTSEWLRGLASHERLSTHCCPENSHSGTYVWTLLGSGHDRPRKWTEICNIGAPSPLDIFIYFGATCVIFFGFGYSSLRKAHFQRCNRLATSQISNAIAISHARTHAEGFALSDKFWDSGPATGSGPKAAKRVQNELPGPHGPRRLKSPKPSRKRVKIDYFSTILTLFDLDPQG